MKINIKKFLLKILAPSLILFIVFRIDSYYSLGYFYPLDFGDVFLFIIMNVVIAIFWELLNYFQEVTGMVMKESWLGRIVFIIIALVLIYLYRATGRI